MTSPPTPRFMRGPTTGNQWISAGTAGHTNSYGPACGEAGSWCVERGITPSSFAVRPSEILNCEASLYIGTGGPAVSCNLVGSITVMIAPTRLGACGF